MNDNDSTPSAEELRFLRTIQGLNIAANGRWCVLLLAAICLARGDLRGALLMALALGASAIVEQLAPRWRRAGVYAVYAWVLLFMIALGFTL